ncbi:MAG: hypothetical protein H7Y89_00335 [Steroidobacteraceae bacterium]|nr:hypothetical protein [Steroidobacteraceae bacterium]
MNKTRVIHTLTRWPFLAALTMLLLNDFWLKSQFPGLITGKLSDFAGIAMIALPLLAMFPRHARAIYLAIAAAFLWWKSPLSGLFIAFANEVLPYRIGRVVDYSDLLALLVLPFCSLATRDVCAESGRLRRVLTIPVIAIAVFATAATSMPPAPQVQITIRTIDPEISLDRAAAADAIESVMKEFRLFCIECARRERNGTYRSDDVSVYYYFSASNSVYFQIYWFNGTWGDSEERKAARVKAALKAEFTKRFRGLEAVEPLRGPYDPAPPPCVSEATSTPHCTATGQPTPTGGPP